MMLALATTLPLAPGLPLELSAAGVGHLSAALQRQETPTPDPPQWAIASDATGLHFVPRAAGVILGPRVWAALGQHEGTC